LQVLQLHAAAEQFTEVTKLLSQNDVGTGRQEVLPVDGHKRVQPGNFYNIDIVFSNSFSGVSCLPSSYLLLSENKEGWGSRYTRFGAAYGWPQASASW
jgi:hypothetical protein